MTCPSAGPLRASRSTLVEINDVIFTQHVREIGRVIHIQTSWRSHTLDKYLVRFASGVEKEFWDIQLTPSIRLN